MLGIQRKYRDPHGNQWMNNLFNNPDLVQLLMNTIYGGGPPENYAGVDEVYDPKLYGNNKDILKKVMDMMNGGLTFGQKLGLGGLSSILGTGGTILTNYLNQKWAKEQQEAQWAQEEKNATTAFNRQKELIETYQTPEAQRGMLEDAGLNVGMMYSKGAGTVGGASVSKANAAGGAVPAMGNPLAIDSMMSMLKTLAEIRNINADTDNKEVETGNKMLTANEQAWKNYILEHTINSQIEIMFNEATIKDCQAWTEFANRAGNAEARAAENAIKGLQKAILEIQKDAADKKYDLDWSDPQFYEGKILGGGQAYMEWQKLQNELKQQGIDIETQTINLNWLRTEKAMKILGSLLGVMGLAV